MSDHVHYNFFRFISYDLREELKAMGYTSAAFAANVCSDLRSRGEFDLAETINREIDESLEERRWNDARKRALDLYPQYESYHEVPDSAAAPFLR